LGKAAGHIKFFQAPVLFFFRIFEDGIDGFFLCQVNKTTGIDHDHRGRFLAFVAHFKVVSFELGFENFRIHYIFTASKGNDLDLLGMD